jgi:branched-chain amino acid transport system permease protein
VTEFLAFTVSGIVTGAIYAVAASGLVVTYTASGIFNFAHGAIGMLMAFTYWELRVQRGWPAPAALFFVILVLAPLLGAVVERTLMRNLQGASTTTSLVVTIGLMVGLIGLAQSIWPAEAREMPAFFGFAGFEVGQLFVTWHEAITIAVAIGVALTLRVLLFSTRLGTSMRAVVDDRNLAALNGARPARISMFSWSLGASLSALSGILLAPVLQLDVLVLTLLVINAYVAAMVGRLKSLPLTFVGALILGLAQSYAVGYVRLEGVLGDLRPSLPTLLLFAVLLLMPEARLRAARLSAVKIPGVPTLRASATGAIAFLGGAWILSGVLTNADLVRVGRGLALGLVMLSLVPLTGYGGQVSLCQMTFAGLGAFAMATLGGGGSPIGLIAAVVLAALVGAVVALPALRLQGLYLGLATMAFAVMMDNMFFANPNVFGTFGSKPVDRLSLFGLSLDGERPYFMLLALSFAALAVFVLWIRRGVFGRRIAAMRDSPAACTTLGLSLTKTKLAIFTLSAGMAGAGGALFGGLQGTAGPTDFVMFQSLPVLLMAVLGGITTVSGALIGGMLLALLPVLQDKAPAVGGLVFLATGAAAVSLGRNPNGLSFMIAQLLTSLMFWKRQPVDAAPSITTISDPHEEAASVGIAAG